MKKLMPSYLTRSKTAAQQRRQLLLQISRMKLGITDIPFIYFAKGALSYLHVICVSIAQANPVSMDIVPMRFCFT